MSRPTRTVARDISYSFSARIRAGKAFVRGVENVTGRLRLLKMAFGYENEVAAGRDFWHVMQERYGISLDLVGEGLANLSAEGPLVVVANHPYRIVDGLAMGRILSTVRGGEFKIIANNVFKKAKDLDRAILAIDFSETKEAVRKNIAARKEALEYLATGGAIGIFPGGTVATSAKPFSRPLDPPWKTFTAKMLAKSDAAVVPMYFEGQNSRLFQIASHLNYTLRMALLINEFDSRVGGPLWVHIGRPLPEAAIDARRRDPKAMMDYLRVQTYRLSPRPVKDGAYGLYLG